jgi:hypothetical protein
MRRTLLLGLVPARRPIPRSDALPPTKQPSPIGPVISRRRPKTWRGRRTNRSIGRSCAPSTIFSESRSQGERLRRWPRKRRPSGQVNRRTGTTITHATMTTIMQAIATAVTPKTRRRRMGRTLANYNGGDCQAPRRSARIDSTRAGVTWPSAGKLARFWYARTAACVRGPARPSTGPGLNLIFRKLYWT